MFFLFGARRNVLVFLLVYVFFVVFLLMLLLLLFVLYTHCVRATKDAALFKNHNHKSSVG